jgi:hypothetical protein
MKRHVNLFRTGDLEYLLFTGKDVMSQPILMRGSSCETEREITRAFLAGQSEPLVVDVGANLGGYTMPVSQLVSKTGGIVRAFEPQQMVFHQLCGNLFINQISNVKAHNIALGDHDGNVEIPIPDYNKETSA